jgi:hypothetical protein
LTAIDVSSNLNVHFLRASLSGPLTNIGCSMSTIADHGALPSRRKTPAYAELFDAPDQRRVREDLATFFGPNAQAYLDLYDRMRDAAPRERIKLRTWSWPVFLGSFSWFFYRKMYLYGAMVIFMPIFFGYLFGSASGAISIIFAMWAKNWYVNYALGRIVKADKLGLTGAERADYLQRAGGVSWLAGILGGLLYGFFLLIIIAGVLAGHKARHG